MYASEAHATARNLVEMGELASARFRDRHPEATEQATEALAWAYTFDWK